MKQITLTLIALIAAITTQAQSFEWNASFQAIGDNREFNRQYAKPQTIIGERTAFELGTTIDSIHTIRIGLSHLYEYGTFIDFNQPQLTAYYDYNTHNSQLLLGAFPRHERIDFPLAMLADTIQYYQPNIEGILAQQNWEWGSQLIFVDWTGKQLSTQRETFIIATSGEIHHKNIYLENYLLMYHYALMAGEHPGQHITDNGALNLNLGYQFPHKQSPFNQSYFELGILASKIRNRQYDEYFTTSTSLLATLHLQWRWIAIKNTLSVGDEHQILTGDSYYSAATYNRTDILFHLIQHPKVKLLFKLSYHIPDGESLDSQQQLFLSYQL
ncbi:MAG: hypothetical protein ACK5LR_00050 [Mangrovibacterium sp.]